MIAIVTDSTAYLTHEEAVELGVVIVPMSYSFGKDMSLNEGCIENDEHAERQVAEAAFVEMGMMDKGAVFRRRQG